MIVIIDYGAGNIRSVARAFKHFNKEVRITDTLTNINKDDLIVLPGVGSFGNAMQELKKRGLYEPIINYVKNGQSFLAICIGLQLCFESSEESPGVDGLGIFKGCVKKFPKKKELSIPQIGWNSLNITNNTFKKFDQEYFYFVHSYYVEPSDKTLVLSTTEYGFEYVSSVIQDNIIATQFHPEKSGKIGLAFLEKAMDYFNI